MAKPVPDFHGMLKVLLNHEVDFIVVGGVCAVLHGAPITTFDLDIVHSRNPDNLTRLVSALADLKAIYRIQPERKLKPEIEHLSSPGHHLLITKAGPLDLLGTIGAGLDYENLLNQTEKLQLEKGSKIPVLNLDTLIEIKEGLADDKDRAMLPVLRRTLEQKSKTR